MGGSFVLSDDAHAVEQVALNYGKVLPSLHAANIEELAYFKPVSPDKAGRELHRISVTEVKSLSFWSD